MKRIKVIGGKKLEGEVEISGSKNAALPVLAATILTQGLNTIKFVPHLIDITTMLRVLKAIGVRAEYFHPNTVKVWVNHTVRHIAPYELMTKMRASFFIIGSILAKVGFAKIPLPGGCAIGSRPVDIHLKGLKALGAQVQMEHGFVIVKAEKLKGTRIYLDFPSVGATETIMMAATKADGMTTIENAAREPEIVDLANFLNLAGAKIEGAGTQEIKITGVSELKSVEYKVIPDRIEAGTFMVAAAITQGEIKIKNIIPDHLDPIISKLKEMEVDVKVEKDKITVKARKKPKAINIKTLPFPGFPTDMQPQFVALLSQAEGTSIVTETLFENRFLHVHELKRMGANIRLEGQSAVIEGVKRLEGAPVKSRDLRAGAALLLAGLSAEGETLIEDIERYIDRGYDTLDKKLKSLGAEIEEVGRIHLVNPATLTQYQNGGART